MSHTQITGPYKTGNRQPTQGMMSDHLWLFQVLYLIAADRLPRRKQVGVQQLVVYVQKITFTRNSFGNYLQSIEFVTPIVIPAIRRPWLFKALPFITLIIPALC